MLLFVLDREVSTLPLLSLCSPCASQGCVLSRPQAAAVSADGSQLRARPGRETWAMCFCSVVKGFSFFFVQLDIITAQNFFSFILEMSFCLFQKAHQITMCIYVLLVLTIQSGVNNIRSLSTNKIQYRAISNRVVSTSGLTNV